MKACSTHVGAAFIKALVHRRVGADPPARTRRGWEMSGTGERGSSVSDSAPALGASEILHFKRGGAGGGQH